MRGMVMFAAGAMVLASPAMAQSMNAETFHKRAEALRKKGPLALFSKGEISALMNEGQAAGKAAGLRIKADKAAGRPSACPPAGPQKMGSSEFMKRLGDIPLAQRRSIDMTEATLRIMAAKFPC